MINSMDDAQKAAADLVATIARLITARDEALAAFDRATDKNLSLEALNMELYKELQAAGKAEQAAIKEIERLTRYDNRATQNDMGKNPQGSPDGGNTNRAASAQGTPGYCIKGPTCPVCTAGLVAPLASKPSPPAVTDWGTEPANSPAQSPADSPAESTGPRQVAHGVKLQSLTAVYEMEIPEPNPIGLNINEIHRNKAPGPKHGASYARDVERQAEALAKATGCTEKGLMHRITWLETVIEELGRHYDANPNSPMFRPGFLAAIERANNACML
jgi:hypothetical protein